MLVLVIDVSIRALAAAAAIAVVLRVLRVRSAALRHGAWASVMVVMLAMPLLTAIVPGVAVPVPSTLAVDPGTVVGFEPRPAPLEDSRTEIAGPASSTAGSPAASTPTGNRHAPVPSASRTSSLAALVVYFAGAALLAARLAAGWMMARGLRRTAAPALVRASVPVLESAAVAAPLAVGVFRPVIVLPVGWQQWRDTKLAAILAHETAHIRRRDALIAFLAEVNRVLFWFHPLAWWLPRTLAAQAELACDDVATEAVEGRREYAEVLVEVAEAVSSRGHRVAWQALGADGSGLLGSRIERLLRGESTQRPSRSAVAATALACAIALGGAVACRQEPPPLQPDPELAKQYAEEARDSSEFQASRKLRLEDVDALERRIDANPNDWEARRRLVTYYNAGEEVPWERKVPGLRRHALWLIEHHPEHEIAAPPLSPQYDPEGFAAAVRLWDQHLGKSDVSPYLVYRAAQFFAAYDRPRAEALILRGMKIDPNSDALKARMPPRVALYEWHNQLAALYVRALLGNEGYYPTTQYHPERAASPYASEVRQKLAASRDARLLARVGSSIVTARSGKGEPVEDMRQLGREYLQRALLIDVDNRIAKTALERAGRNDRHERVWHAVKDGGPVADADRLAYLATRASYHYMQLEAAESWRPDKEAARKAHADAKAAAEGALALAAERRDSADYPAAVMTAHQTLGLIALRDGDRKGAVRHMLASVDVPEVPSNSIVEAVYGAQRLPSYLLKEGERETVIQYYEAAAKIAPSRQRETLLADAEAVRQGRMPRNYQAVFARAR